MRFSVQTGIAVPDRCSQNVLNPVQYLKRENAAYSATINREKFFRTLFADAVL